MLHDSTSTVKFHHNCLVSICNNVLGCRIYEVNGNLNFRKNEKRDLIRLVYTEDNTRIRFVEPMYVDAKLIIAIIKENVRPIGTDSLDVIRRKTVIFNNPEYPYPVLSCTSINNKLVVCIEIAIYIYTLRDYVKNNFIEIMCTPYMIRTPSNPNGIYALGKFNFAYPKFSDSGVIEICRLKDKFSISTIGAHERSLSAIAFDSTNNYIATASKFGSIILVYSCYTRYGQPIYKFQRGASNANITSLSFSEDFAYLGCASNAKTLQIFKLSGQDKEKPKDSNLFKCIRGTIIASIQGEKSYYTATLPDAGLKSNLIIKSTNPLKLLVVTNDSFIKLYTTSTTSGAKGEELSLLKEQEL